MKWSLSLGKISGIRLSIHWTFIILLVWIFIMYYQRGNEIGHAFMGVLFILLLFVCVILHELGHALTAKRFNIVTKSITLLPIGGLAQMERLPEKPGQELWVALAGPLVNIVIAFILFFFLSMTNSIPSEITVEYIEELSGSAFWFNLYLANIVLAVFNMIPAFPMDGGRVLRALLAYKYDRGKATRIAASIGQFLAIVFVFFGFYANIWLSFIGIFIYLGAGAEANFETTKSSLSGYTVQDVLIKKYVRLLPDDSLEKVVQHLLNSQEKEFLVVKEEKVLGILTKQELIKGLADSGKESLVSSAMQKEYLTLSPDLPLNEAYQNLVTSGYSVALVIHEGEILGIVDTENINELLLVNKALSRS